MMSTQRHRRRLLLKSPEMSPAVQVDQSPQVSIPTVMVVIPDMTLQGHSTSTQPSPTSSGIFSADERTTAPLVLIDPSPSGSVAAMNSREKHVDFSESERPSERAVENLQAASLAVESFYSYTSSLGVLPS